MDSKPKSVNQGVGSKPDLRPTYAFLQSHFAASMKGHGTDELVVRNWLGTLRAYMKWCGRRDDDVVGREFFENFDRNLLQWLEDQTTEGKAQRTIQDRAALLPKWQTFVEEMNEVDPLPPTFSGALTEAIRRSGRSIRSVAIEADISDGAVARWAAGKSIPAMDVVPRLTKLEKILGLPEGILAKRLPHQVGQHLMKTRSKLSDAQLTTHARRHLARMNDKNRPKFHQPPHPQVEQEWKELLVFKTNALRKGASGRDIWRMKRPERAGRVHTKFATMGSMVVPSADAHWTFLSRYFSWLQFSPEYGGAGIAPERLCTLGWVMDERLMDAFAAWCVSESGGILHAGVVKVYEFACMMLRKESGWLWLKPEIALRFSPEDSPLPFDPRGLSKSELTAQWQAECERLCRCYRESRLKVTKSKQLAKARDPQEPIADILQMADPVEALMEMLAQLASSEPPASGRIRRAVWLRDVLLLAIVTSNPLRVGHFAIATYRSDNTGNLFRNSEGLWSMRFRRDDFKNSTENYVVVLADHVQEHVDAYLKHGRPHLWGASESDYLFLSTRHGKKQKTVDAPGTAKYMWNSVSISMRLSTMSEILRPGKRRFGPHAYRHIVVTAFLRKHPGAFALVAELLCDNIRTVMKEYGHLTPQDGLNIHYRDSQAAYQRAMKKFKRKPGPDAMPA